MIKKYLSSILAEIIQFLLIHPRIKMSMMKVKKLFEIASNVVSSNLSEFCNRANGSDLDLIQAYYCPLPLPIQNALSEKSNSNDYLQIVTDFRTRKLKITQGGSIVRNSLLKAENLTQLQIQINCNELLPLVGQNCVKLQFLEIKDNVKDDSFKWIVPSQNHGCPDLQILILNIHCSCCEDAGDTMSDDLKVDLLNKFTSLKVYSCSVQYHFDLGRVSAPTKLETFLFNHSDRISHDQLPRVFPKLRRLKTRIMSQEMKYLLELPDLISLEIDEWNPVGGMVAFQQLLQQHCNSQNIKEISYNEIKKGDLLSIAENCPQIEKLTIIGLVPWDIKEVIEFQEDSFKKLKEFRIDFSGVVSGDEEGIKNVTISVLSKACNIETLELSLYDGVGILVEEDNVEQIEYDGIITEILDNPLCNMNQLKQLKLHDEDGVIISPSTMRRLMKLPNINQIVIEEPGWKSGSPDLLNSLILFLNQNNFDVNLSIPLVSSSDSDDSDNDEVNPMLDIDN